MNMELQEKEFQLVTDVKIPDVFYRRFKTGIEALDKLLGEGFLPGSSFTLTAPAGTGKTTITLQMLDSLALNQGKKVAYASGEENVAQLAFTCDRLGVKNISVANKTDIDDLVKDIKKRKLDVLIIDSFQCLRTENADTVRGIEEYAITNLINAGKVNECVIGFIVHQTKQGKLKGGSLIPHAVDMNMDMEPGDEEIYGTDQARILNISKNRFGSTGDKVFYMGSVGFDFAVSTETVKEEGAPAKTRASSGSKEHNIKLLLEAATEQRLTLGLATELTGNYHRAKNLLKELELTGKLYKWGRGNSAIWRLAS